MTRRLARLAPAARVWLLDEIAYLAARNPIAARAVVDLFRRARENLALFPRMARPGLIPGTRRLVVGPYVLTVRPRGNDVEIVAIRHGRQRDPTADDA